MAYTDTGSAITIYSGSYTGKARLYISCEISYPSDTTYKITATTKLQMYNRSGHAYKVTEADGSSHSGTSGGSYPGSGKWYTTNSWSGTLTGSRSTVQTSRTVSASGSVINTNSSSYKALGKASVSVPIAAIPYIAVYGSAGTGGTVTPASQSVKPGTTVSLSASASPGYTFSHWNTGDTTPTISKTVSVATTFTAYFTANTYALNFDSQGGSSVSSKSVTYNAAVGTLTTPTKQYYNFAGWKDASGNTYTDATVYKVLGNTTLYAQWNAQYVVPQWDKCVIYRSGQQKRDLTVSLQWINGTVAGVTRYPRLLKGEISADGGITWATLFTVSNPAGIQTDQYTRTITDIADTGSKYSIKYTLDDGYGTPIVLDDFVTKTSFIWRLNAARDTFQIGKNIDIDGSVNATGIGLDLLDVIMPVGFVIEVSDLNPTFNPNTAYPGTNWRKIQGRVLVGAGTSDTAYSLGGTGGASQVTLTENEMPSHGHYGGGWQFLVYTGTRENEDVGGISGKTHVMPQIVKGSGSWGNYGTIPAAGGGKPHNNMPPYKVVNMWERIA